MIKKVNNTIFLSIVVPVFNEEKTITNVINELIYLKKICKIEIIVVNDGSTDKSKKIINNNKSKISKIIHFEKNKGKGKAVIEGIKNCNGDYILVQDADLEYDPKDIKKFITKIKEGVADCILGSRFIGSERSVLHFWHMIGNKFITTLFNILNNTAFSDIYCCYLLFKKNAIKTQKLKSYGWGQHAEILTFVIKNSNKPFEIAVRYNSRTYKDGKKIKYYNVFEVVYWIINTRIKTIFSS